MELAAHSRSSSRLDETRLLHASVTLVGSLKCRVHIRMQDQVVDPKIVTR